MENQAYRCCLCLSLVVTLSAGCDPDSASLLVPPDATPDSSKPMPDAAIDADAPDMVQAPDCVPINQDYDPLANTRLTQFPDDIYAVASTDSPTGIQLATDAARFPWMEDLPPFVSGTLPDMAHLSGFSRVGRVFVSFDSPFIAEDADQSALNPDAVILIDMDADPPQTLETILSWGPERETLFAQPLYPMKAGRRHALVVSDALADRPGSCFKPSPLLREFLSATTTDEALEGLATRYREAVAASGLEAESVVAATVFTTHDDLGPMFATAAAVQRRQYRWADDVECRPLEDWIQCETSFEARDYRDERGIVGERPQDTRRVPVTVHLPANRQGPVPFILYGHGLNNTRFESEFLAREATAVGYAVVAADAMMHGEHPSRTDPDSLAALDFLGLDLSQLKFDAFGLRGNFNQSVIDRLQLLRLALTQADVDGDNLPDLDPALSVYFGASLGGMLGTATMALTEELQAGVLSVAGGRLIGLVLEIGGINSVRPLLANVFGTEQNLERILVLAQTLIDAADPAVFAGHVLHDRRTGDEAFRPHLMMPVSTIDETVAPPSGFALARSLGIPHLEPVITPVRGLEVEPSGAQANHGDGRTTLGYFQYDRITQGGQVQPAVHNRMPLGDEAMLQLRAFFEPLLSGAPPQIIDPYEALGTPALD